MFDFEEKIAHVIKCGDRHNDRILTDTYFDKKEMLPELYEEREKPTAYYFMPLHYEDCIFGYAAVSYGERPIVFPPEYRAWLKSICRGIECYKRADELIGSNRIAKKGLTIDNLTIVVSWSRRIRFCISCATTVDTWVRWPSISRT